MLKCARKKIKDIKDQRSRQLCIVHAMSYTVEIIHYWAKMNILVQATWLI